ncbi:hypothetical protein [Myxacorys almedinensis]|uniref:hypothetical protein n=1 Tax=Myxacorys almedinensis TaxID=2651157 RepID=UPI0013920389|nr:hypothetical protein [Myxacorys almedinensis]
MKRQQRSQVKTFLGTSLLTFLTLVLIFFGLPALFLLFNVPSFKVGEGVLWVLSWQNTAESSAIRFNVVPLVGVALVSGLLSLWTQHRQPRNH